MTTKGLVQMLDEAEAMMLQIATTLDDIRKSLGLPSIGLSDMDAALQRKAEMEGEDALHHVAPDPEPEVQRLPAIRVKSPDHTNVKGLPKDDPRRKIPISIQDRYIQGREGNGVWERIRKVRFFGQDGTVLRVYLTHNVVHIWKYDVKGWRNTGKELTK